MQNNRGTGGYKSQDASRQGATTFVTNLAFCLLFMISLSAADHMYNGKHRVSLASKQSCSRIEHCTKCKALGNCGRRMFVNNYLQICNGLRRNMVAGV